jgi:hypothetical protein
MLLMTIFVELRVVAGTSRTWAGSPQAIFRWPCCAVALRRTTWSGMDRREADWHASDNNLCGTPCGSRKKPNAGR